MRLISARRPLVATVVLFGLAGAAFAGTGSLLTKLPADANTLSSIDVDAVAASPVAKTQGWFDPAKRKADNNPLFIPRGSKQVVVATQIDDNKEAKYGV